jgi:hypothetical protein
VAPTGLAPHRALADPFHCASHLAARIDRLAPEAKRLLQAAAVIGKDVPLPLLLAIAEAPQNEARAELTRLQNTKFLYEVRPFPDLECTFKHSPTRACFRRSALLARTIEVMEQHAANGVAPWDCWHPIGGVEGLARRRALRTRPVHRGHCTGRSRRAPVLTLAM